MVNHPSWLSGPEALVTPSTMDHGASPQEEHFHDSLEDWGEGPPASPLRNSPRAEGLQTRLDDDDLRVRPGHFAAEQEEEEEEEEDGPLHTGSFTFSEDDLIPAGPTSYFGDYHSHASHVYAHSSRHRGKEGDDEADVLYSSAPPKSFDPKISVSRAVLVSQPNAVEPQQQSSSQSLSRSNSRSLARSTSLSRRFTNFTRKPKQDAKMKARSSEQEAEAIVYSLADAGFKLPHRKGAKSGADTVVRPMNTTQSEDGPPADSMNNHLQQQQHLLPSRNDSVSRKKSRMSFGSLLRFTPPSDTPPESPSDDGTRSLENHAAEVPREPTPDQTPRRYPTTPLPRPSPSTSNPSSVPQSSHSDAQISMLQGTVDDSLLPPKAEYKPNRDELWSLFRVVDAEHQKFLSVPIDQKGEPVRRVLLPFLKTTREHHSNTNLEPLDLDRRITILNKWWTALLDTLSNKVRQQISASDRPSLLEATTSIMERPEWRAYPSPFCPSSAARPGQKPRQGSEQSSDSDHDKFVEESVHHNVRNMFVHNLFTQIKFAVDKMALKNIPVGLVSFCGKTCAFAFFFCGGIGEILIRLWDLSSHNIQRIFRSSSLSLLKSYQDGAEQVASVFPSGLRSMICHSFKGATALVKAKQTYPLGVDKVDWRGGWLKRWSGHESDLFYTFVREYHTILSQFLPVNTHRSEYVWAPGLLFVRAQILANLESTLHRNPNSAATESSPEPLLSLDGLLDPNDSNASFPGPLSNSSRFMGENRLVMLIRSITSENCQLDTPVCFLIAEGFSDALRAAVESTSLYNHNACSTLCEMLQESLPALATLQKKQRERALIDWNFWVTVFRKMTESENTMTELRLYAMLFSVWDSIAAVEKWRNALCNNFLLDQAFFCSRFSHWCPMLRCYFQRLLCWRVARYNDEGTEASESDKHLLGLLRDRLMLVWSHFKYGVSVKAGSGGPGISTAPSNPLPGRRLLIIRSNVFINPPLMPLESFHQQVKKGTAESPKEAGGGIQSVVPFFEKIASGLDMGKNNKRNNSLFRSMFGYSNSNSSSGSREQSPNREKSEDLSTEVTRKDMSSDQESSRTSMYEARPLKAPPPISTRNKTEKQNPTSSRRVKATFKFSMELLDRYPQNNTPDDMALYPPRLPVPAQQVLEANEEFVADVAASRPKGEASRRVIYLGHALAEWYLTVNECQNFFERRKNEGVPSNRLVETPTLTADTLRRPGL